MERRKFIKGTAAAIAGTLWIPNSVGLNVLSTVTSKTTDLWSMSALELVGLITQKQVSVHEIIKAHIERIHKVNPLVNGLTTILEENALQLAKEKDRVLSGNPKISPLFGIPFSVKENIDLSGSATTDGVIAFKDNIVTADAPQITSFKQAGAIPIARSNMPDFALRYHTESGLYGATLNPWNQGLTPGGSSGGDAVAVATGMVPIGLGNDYGGSLRFPAQCNGVCSIRPSRGRIPYFSGSIPHNNVPHSVKMFAVQGPIARTIADLKLALQIMSASDHRDPNWIPAPLNSGLSKPYKIALITNPGNLGVDNSVRAAITKAGKIFEQDGAIVEEVDSTSLRESMNLWGQIVTTDIRNVFFDVIQEYASAPAIQFVEEFLNLYPEVTLEEYVNTLARVNGIAAAWEAYFQNYDAIVGPISSREPFEVGFDVKGNEEAKYMLDSQALTVTVNLLGLPSVSVPVEISNKLPQSVQIICPIFKENRCLILAKIIEDEVGNFTPIFPNSK